MTARELLPNEPAPVPDDPKRAKAVDEILARVAARREHGQRFELPLVNNRPIPRRVEPPPQTVQQLAAAAKAPAPKLNNPNLTMRKRIRLGIASGLREVKKIAAATDANTPHGIRIIYEELREHYKRTGEPRVRIKSQNELIRQCIAVGMTDAKEIQEHVGCQRRNHIHRLLKLAKTSPG